MWVLIDNYDSFTHILHHYLLETGAACRVVRNDELSIEALRELNPSRIILSPGPGRPEDAGITMAALQHFHRQIPILGICLGHQAIGTFFGMSLTHAAAPAHGKQSLIEHTGAPVFYDVPLQFEVMRYHSLALQSTSGSRLEVIATTVKDGTIMAIRHPLFPITGLQFHPESVGTAYGMQLIKNWSDSP